jgi:hypothetical protein
MAGRISLPSIPKGAKTLHEMNADALFKRPDRFSKEWFSTYDDPRSTPIPTKDAFIRKVITEKRKAGDTTFTHDTARAAIKGLRIRATGSAVPKPTTVPKKAAVSKQSVRPSVVPKPPAKPVTASKIEATSEEVKRECALFKKSIDELVTTHPTLIKLHKFPQLESKYQRRFFEEKDRIKSIVDSECFYGRKPDRSILVDMNKLISEIDAEMRKKGGKKTRRKGNKNKSKTRKNKGKSRKNNNK